MMFSSFGAAGPLRSGEPMLNCAGSSGAPCRLAASAPSGSRPGMVGDGGEFDAATNLLNAIPVGD